MRRWLGALVFLPLISLASPNLTGKYQCTGHDFLNHSTFDEPTLVKKTGETYSFTWINKNLLFTGTGVLLNNQVAIIFTNAANPCQAGVTTYQLLSNGDLKGKWTVKDSHEVGDEYCYKLKS